jgi:hypothetical protein
MSYLRHLCLFVYNDVQHNMCCVLICFSSSCEPYVASFSGFLIAPSVLSYVYLK